MDNIKVFSPHEAVINTGAWLQGRGLTIAGSPTQGGYIWTVTVPDDANRAALVKVLDRHLKKWDCKVDVK